MGELAREWGRGGVFHSLCFRAIVPGLSEPGVRKYPSIVMEVVCPDFPWAVYPPAIIRDVFHNRSVYGAKRNAPADSP